MFSVTFQHSNLGIGNIAIPESCLIAINFVADIEVLLSNIRGSTIHINYYTTSSIFLVAWLFEMGLMKFTYSARRVDILNFEVSSLCASGGPEYTLIPPANISNRGVNFVDTFCLFIKFAVKITVTVHNLPAKQSHLSFHIIVFVEAKLPKCNLKFALKAIRENISDANPLLVTIACDGSQFTWGTKSARNYTVHHFDVEFGGFFGDLIFGRRVLDNVFAFKVNRLVARG